MKNDKTNYAFVLDQQRVDDFTKQDNKNFRRAIDRFERHNRSTLSPPVNIDEYNSHLVSDEFLQSCAKAGRLFEKNT